MEQQNRVNIERAQTLGRFRDMLLIQRIKAVILVTDFMWLFMGIQNVLWCQFYQKQNRNDEYNSHRIMNVKAEQSTIPHVLIEES